MLGEMGMLRQSRRTQIAINFATKQVSQVTLSGRATNDDIVGGFLDFLRASDLLNQLLKEIEEKREIRKQIVQPSNNLYIP
jgi:hypothetical protein